MKLYYKAWRESRIRFAAAAATVAFLCWRFLSDGWQHPPAIQASFFDDTWPIPYSKRVWQGVWMALRAPFTLFVLLLGLGGLQRERAAGSAALTLALPASRLHLAASRALVGLLQVAALAAVPAVMVPTLSPVYAQEAYPWAQALRFFALYLTVGSVVFAASFLVSTVFVNEHTTVAACVMAPFIYLAAVDQFWRMMSAARSLPLRDAVRQFRSANVFDVMVANDMPNLDAGTFLLRSVPWVPVAVLVVVACGLIALAVHRTRAEDF